MVMDVGLSLSFWAETVNTACYTQNCSIIMKIISKPSYQLVKGRKPDISYFHVFGCVFFILIQKDRLSKFQEKENEGIFLGYSFI